MKHTFKIVMTLIGFAALLSSCEKDETQVVMSTDPIPPAIQTMPNLTLERGNATDTLVFTGTPVDPGFTASATYFLEACVSGNGFEDAVVLYTGVQNKEIKMTVSALNSVLIKKLPADATSATDFRVRAVLVVDAGTGALGTSSSPLEYISSTVTADVTIYGLPRLDLINSGITQKIELANGDGVYTGFVKLDAAMAFTLLDPDANVSYGGAADALSVDGAAIVPDASGWHKLTANTNDLTYTIEAYMIGLVGSATPNGWDSPDQKMDYDAATDTWNITIDLIDGDIKFRLNDGWAWNLGGTEDNLVHNGDNITVTAGNYTIALTVTNYTGGSEAGSYTIVKND